MMGLLNHLQVYNWQNPDMITKLNSTAFSIDTWLIFINALRQLQNH